MIDAARFPRQKVCGEYLSSAAWQLLDELGLGISAARPSNCRACGWMWPAAAARCSIFPRRCGHRLRSAATASTPRWSRPPARPASTCSRDTASNRCCRPLAGDGRRGHRRRSSARSETFRAPLIVAADGRRSLVVRDTGRVVRGRSGLVGFKAHADGPMPTGTASRRSSCTRFPMATLAFARSRGGGSTSAASCPGSGCAQSRGNLAEALRLWIAESGPSPSYLDIDRERDGWLTMPEVAIQRSYPHAGGVLYVGDAMGTIEPLTGQGMTMALASARLAATHLVGRQRSDGRSRRTIGLRAGLARAIRGHDPLLALDGLAVAPSPRACRP